VNERPGRRRARVYLLLAGLLVAASVVAVESTAVLLGAVVPGTVALALVAAPVVAGVAAGFSARARRACTTAMVRASMLAAVGGAVVLGLLALLLLLGRVPAGSEQRMVGPATAGIVLAAACSAPFARRAARRMREVLHAAPRSPDELLADFAENAGRGSPVDDLIRTLAESMRRDWQLSRVEIWTGHDDLAAVDARARGPVAVDSDLHRTLVVPSSLEPDGDPAPAPLDVAEQRLLRRSGVAGPGWLRLWVPRLLDGRGDRGAVADRQLRFAPAVHGGSVLALVLVERPLDSVPFSTADDRALGEVARRLAIVLRNRSLDIALQSTLADLRRANAELQASRRRLVTTADAERRRIERDLHDGAQQHLVALAVGIRLIRDGFAESATPTDLALIDELDRGVRESIASLRDLAHGIYPPLLRDAGLREALRAAAQRSPFPVTVVAEDLGRHPEQVEAAVYFCCLEALANAAKHAAGASVTLVVEAAPGELRFEITDTGPGFDPAEVPAGAGLSNMADRIGALGGEVTWRSAPGQGTTVTGRAPVPRSPVQPGPAATLAERSPSASVSAGRAE